MRKICCVTLFLLYSLPLLFASPMLDYIKSQKTSKSWGSHSVTLFIIIIVLALVFIIAAFINAHKNRKK